jgi:hypothetical protein
MHHLHMIYAPEEILELLCSNWPKTGKPKRTPQFFFFWSWDFSPGGNVFLYQEILRKIKRLPSENSTGVALVSQNPERPIRSAGAFLSFYQGRPINAPLPSFCPGLRRRPV